MYTPVSAAVIVSRDYLLLIALIRLDQTEHAVINRTYVRKQNQHGHKSILGGKIHFRMYTVQVRKSHNIATT